MKRKYPATWSDAIKKIKADALEIAALTQKVADAQADREAAGVSRREAVAESRAVQRESEETRKHFADLKERLANAESETARLRGYLDRVREDDNVADPLIEVEDEAGKRLVSKRHPSSRSIRADSNMMDYLQGHCASGREKVKHWTSY